MQLFVHFNQVLVLVVDVFQGLEFVSEVLVFFARQFPAVLLISQTSKHLIKLPFSRLEFKLQAIGQPFQILQWFLTNLNLMCQHAFLVFQIHFVPFLQLHEIMIPTIYLLLGPEQLGFQVPILTPVFGQLLRHIHLELVVIGDKLGHDLL